MRVNFAFSSNFHFISAIPVAPKTLRKDEAGNSVGIRIKPVIQLSKPVAIAPKPIEREPDYFMLNKPPPIAWALPKSAALAPRQPPTVNSDPLNEAPDVALKKLETEATTLKEEVAALKWLAKRKEQEWNNIVELLKKKEETWLKVKRQAELAMLDKGLHKLKSVNPNVPTTLPSMPDPAPPVQIRRTTPSVVINSASRPQPIVTTVSPASTANAQGPRKVLVPVSQPLTQQTIQALSSQGLLKSGGLTADGKRIIVVKKSVGSMLLGQNTITSTPNVVIGTSRTNAGSTVTKVVMASPKGGVVTAVTSSGVKHVIKPSCGACKKPSKFECAGCSKMWYCSKECQEKNWSKHESECGQSKVVVKQEIITD